MRVEIGRRGMIRAQQRRSLGLDLLLGRLILPHLAPPHEGSPAARHDEWTASPDHVPDAHSDRAGADHRLHLRGPAVVGVRPVQPFPAAIRPRGPGSIGIVALSARAYGSAAVFAAVALVHGAAIKDLWLGGTASAAPGGVPLRLVSANVLAHNRTPEKVIEFVRAADADLVLLVDAGGRDWREVLGQLRDLYPHHAQQAWRARARVILFSRWPIVFEQVRQAPRSSAAVPGGQACSRGPDARRRRRSSLVAVAEPARRHPPSQP